jgi:tellurite resistance protein TehA-like permease
MFAALTVFAAAYAAVLLLRLQSKLMRDDKWVPCFFVSWMIMFAQTAGTYAIAHNTLPIGWFLWWCGWGGSLGIVSSHFIYAWYDKRFKK